MSLKQDLEAVGKALCVLSPIVVGEPAAVRFVLLRRYVEMSMRNARLSLLAFGVMLFVIAHEAPLSARVVAWSAVAVVYLVRAQRARRMLAALDPDDPRSDRVYDLLLLVASSVWGVAPFLLEPWLSPVNLYAVAYAALIATALLAVTYIAALPASVVLVGCSAVPLTAFFALQGESTLWVLAAGTLTCGVALLLRLAMSHGTLLQAIRSERENAALVEELQRYRRVLETENATLDTSLRAASRAATRDPLTGLFNRRHIVAFAASLGDVVREGAEPVTVCMVDVDHFKRINDAHGHPVGDEVLRAIGALLGTRLREADCLARIGGEEFMIVLRHCDLARGRRVAESVRHNVAASQIVTTAGEVPVTVSLGVAQWGAGEAFDAVARRADRALYEAKHSGRDCVGIDATDSARMALELPFGPSPSDSVH
jgi:diguanylate cyclase (GGDEF)-like protein